MKWCNRKVFYIPMWVIGLAALVAAVGYAEQEMQQLETYYPAPYGEYNEMKVTEKLTVLENGELVAGNIFKATLTRGNPYPVQAASVADLNDTTFRIDPSSDGSDPNMTNKLYRLTIFHDPTVALKPGERPSSMTVGGMEFKGWPVLTRTSNYTNLPGAPSIKDKDTSMKLYYGTVTNNTKIQPVVNLPAVFTEMNYFIMILPRQFHKDGTLGLHHHQIRLGKIKWGPIKISLGSTHSKYAASSTYFTYYKWSLPANARQKNSFTIAFEEAIPKDFDWIAIGY